MNLSMIYKGLLAAAIMVTAMMSQQQVQAACGLGSICCPKCKSSCKLKAEKVDVEKKCFEVESKTICIPRVVFPWQMPKKKAGCSSCDSCDGNGCSSCVNNGATTRTIRVLKTKKYKCPECKYTWSAEKPSCGGGCSGTGCGGCASGSCAASGGCTGTACDGCAACSSGHAPSPVMAPMPTMAAPTAAPVAMPYEASTPQTTLQHYEPKPAASDYYSPVAQ